VRLLSYNLARKIHYDLKSDEQIIAGMFIHPALGVHAHRRCVIQCTLFNKSKRKAYIHNVSASNRHGAKVDVTWSDQIDNLGNPQDPCQLIGLVDVSALFIRKNDGQSIDYARVTICHSFSRTPMEAIFDSLAWSVSDANQEC
jgi:hypothetical protein